MIDSTKGNFTYYVLKTTEGTYLHVDQDDGMIWIGESQDWNHGLFDSFEEANKLKEDAFKEDNDDRFWGDTIDRYHIEDISVKKIKGTFEIID